MPWWPSASSVKSLHFCLNQRKETHAQRDMSKLAHSSCLNRSTKSCSTVRVLSRTDLCRSEGAQTKGPALWVHFSWTEEPSKLCQRERRDSRQEGLAGNSTVLSHTEIHSILCEGSKFCFSYKRTRRREAEAYGWRGHQP